MRAATGRMMVAPLPPQGSQEPTWCHTDPLSQSHMLSPFCQKEWPWLHGVQSPHSQGHPPGEGSGKPTPLFLPGASPGQRSLAGCSAWGLKELDTTERLTHTHLVLSPRTWSSHHCCFLEAAGSAQWEVGGADSSRSAPSQRPSLDLG